MDETPSVSVPVVERPDSVTHWTCPKSEWGDTHHIGAASACVYCGRSVAELRTEQVRYLTERRAR